MTTLKKTFPHLVFWQLSRPNWAMSASTLALRAAAGTAIENSAAYSRVSRHVCDSEVSGLHSGTCFGQDVGVSSQDPEECQRRNWPFLGARGDAGLMEGWERRVPRTARGGLLAARLSCAP